MECKKILEDIAAVYNIRARAVTEAYPDEIYIDTAWQDFKIMCLALHKALGSPAMAFFAHDERAEKGVFTVICAFLSTEHRKWFLVRMGLNQESPEFNSLSKEMYSATLFEREMKEMFGLEPVGNPDTRRLHLHDEVWPDGFYPMRKDFKPPLVRPGSCANLTEYVFNKVEGDGVFEIPVGPVHAGIIGPGHFRFSAAGEPIINLEIRLGFTHRGAEKLFEGRRADEAVGLAECVNGDAAFSHSLAFCRAVEKICAITVDDQIAAHRAIYAELERMYNHVAGIGGMATDVGFSFPSAYASIIKESIHSINGRLTGSRYLKGVNLIGGIAKRLDASERIALAENLKRIECDFRELKAMLLSSVSFMDRVETTGTLRKKTAEDLGVVGLAARAAGIPIDLRKVFPDVYAKAQWSAAHEVTGDVLARLKVRIAEFETSLTLIEQFLGMIDTYKAVPEASAPAKMAGSALGYVEGWRGPILYWVKLNEGGIIDRCKIVDASFHNWQALSFAVLGNIVPDFPLCNKSFDLSYAGNDL